MFGSFCLTETCDPYCAVLHCGHLELCENSLQLCIVLKNIKLFEKRKDRQKKIVGIGVGKRLDDAKHITA